MCVARRGELLELRVANYYLLLFFSNDDTHRTAFDVLPDRRSLVGMEKLVVVYKHVRIMRHTHIDSLMSTRLCNVQVSYWRVIK